MANKHATVAFFVPNLGCAHQCSFCDQWAISDRDALPSPEDVHAVLQQAGHDLEQKNRTAQVAFFGGSFTAIDKKYMVSLLQSVQMHLDNNIFRGLRISTRPDAIDKETLDILKEYHVTDIELGAQSMVDSVLQANLRGHTAAQTADAARMIKDRGFGLGLQIMTGLYKDSVKYTKYTVDTIIQLKPDCVRIYPTVALRGTTLAQLYNQGRYKPQPLDEAVALCAELLESFTRAAIPVIRLGLHDGPKLRESIVAGPHHPAFRELCESRVLMRKTQRLIVEKQIPPGMLRLKVAPGSESKMAGHKRCNLLALERLGYSAHIGSDTKIGYLEVHVT